MVEKSNRDPMQVKSYGYFGKILEVDLSRMKIVEKELEKDIERMFIGGAGLAAKFIFDRCDPPPNPLSPYNLLVCSVGPFQGTGFPVPGSGRWNISARSPLTGVWGESCAGGYWGTEFKMTGHDAVLITGRAQSPVYLYIHEMGAEIKSASHLWGKTTYEAEEEIKEELGDKKVRVASIGPAGKNLVRFACVVADLGHGVAGRCGMGAVMGSKNLKAIAVRGEKKVEVAEPEKLELLCRDLWREIPKHTRELSMHGTASYLPVGMELGDVPVKNWREGEWWEGVKKISPPVFTEKILVSGMACTSCPVGCHRYVRVKTEEFEFEGAGPEYECLAMIGPNLLIDDLEKIAYANHLMNQLGMDVISLGGVVAFAMECYERGLITKRETGGLEIKWGDGDALLSLIRLIAERRGIGNLLADGVRTAAQRIGKGSEDFACHVKGLEIPAHDPRRPSWVEAINYATGNRGGCHERGDTLGADLRILKPEVGLSEPPKPFTAEGKARYAIGYQNHCCLYDSLVQCKFMGCEAFGITQQLELLNAITGWGMNIEEFWRAGERIFTIQRLFNIRCGVRRRDDVLPKRMLEPTTSGPQQGKVPEMEAMLRDYYEMREWDEEGRPKIQKLRELGL
ncbi:MAG: aldehyde ferredoxin oxidoreductase family protein [Candidatus Hadarchaeales archaeon]